MPYSHHPSRPFIALMMCVCCCGHTAIAQQDKPADQDPVAAADDAADDVADDAPAPDPLTEQAIEALAPLLDQIVTAKSSRSTVELSVDTVVDGAVISSQTSIYQIASTAPGSFTIYLKEDARRTRIYCDGKTATIALSTTAYTTLDAPIPMQRAVFELPVPMGAYPEPVLALTLAGVDPKLTLTTGMKSVRLVDREKFRGETPAVHFTAVQDDDVKWDLWMTQDKVPQPLRLLVDLSDMLRANGGLDLPAGYRYLLRFDFKSWRINQENDPSLYQYKLVEGAEKFDSIADFHNAQQQP
ncbi:DUF2092 domain-containing protein [Stieleria sp. TO1_6]|uniref:DUF2092 domain-containing protein n=1 Tax=Stieleria tagensis TaxID=2956795 RepID=UPI00209B2D1F|nr:DUF2092 domain-containing protein [Stieleria tagensis]MCO8122242.1 DUF2092 domain-containing protein [Stieleria tagensis]